MFKTKKEAELYAKNFQFTNYDIIMINGTFDVVPKEIKNPILVKDWKELDALKLGNDNIYLQVEGNCCGWIKKKRKNGPGDILLYLSTHTFYKSKYKESTNLLQMYGFPVVLESWG